MDAVIQPHVAPFSPTGRRPSHQNAGKDPHRILLMGGGPSVGYAVLTHQLGLGGHLARQISAHTGRGCILDIVANPHMTAQDAPDALSQVRLSDYDAVVTTFGGNEALALMSTRTWRNLMNGMLSAIHTFDASPHASPPVTPTAALCR